MGKPDMFELMIILPIWFVKYYAILFGKEWCMAYKKTVYLS